MSKPGRRWSGHVGQVGYVLLGSAVVVGVVLTLAHARQDVYYIPLYGVGIALGAFVVAAAGIVLGWRSGRFGRVALTMLGVAVGLLGVVSLPILLPALVLVLALLAAATRGSAEAAATGAGVLVGLGACVLALVALSPPLVDCADGSAGENVFMGIASNSASGSGSDSADGRTHRGRAQGDTYAYTYTCRDGKLAQFSIQKR